MGVALEEFSTSQKKQLVVKASYFQLIVGQLYKLGPDDILQRCVILHEQGDILEEAHAGVADRHYGGRATARKVLHTGHKVAISINALEKHHRGMRCHRYHK